MNRNNQCVPARDVADFAFGQETVLFRESSQAFCRLNDTASLIWELLKTGHDQPGIVTRLAQEHAVEQQLAAGYVQSLLDDLTGNGFLGAGAPRQTGREANRDGTFRPRSWRSAAAALPWHSWFRVHNVLVKVGSDDRECLELVKATFGFLMVEPEPEEQKLAVDMSIEQSPAGRFRVCYADITVNDCRLDQVPPLVHAALFLRFYEHNFRFLAFHSAAVCSASGLVVLPGTSGSGKSTLTAALVSSGFQHVTDELLLVDLPGESLLGAPLAIGLKRGSWDLGKGLFPQVERLPAFQRQDGRAVKYLSPPALCSDYSLRAVRAMVFPVIAADDQVSVQQLSVPEAFFRLTEAGYDTHRTLSREHVGLLFEWIGAIPAFEVRYRSLERAVEEITSLCED
jgi:hypothetical protein